MNPNKPRQWCRSVKYILGGLAARGHVCVQLELLMPLYCSWCVSGWICVNTLATSIATCALTVNVSVNGSTISALIAVKVERLTWKISHSISAGPVWRWDLFSQPRGHCHMQSTWLCWDGWLWGRAWARCQRGVRLSLLLPVPQQSFPDAALRNKKHISHDPPVVTRKTTQTGDSLTLSCQAHVCFQLTDSFAKFSCCAAFLHCVAQQCASILSRPVRAQHTVTASAARQCFPHFHSVVFVYTGWSCGIPCVRLVILLVWWT